MFDDLSIQQVRDRIDIVDLISHFGVDLVRRGSRYFACCPFHNERTPSFCVSPSRNSWHCFGCGKGGDGIAFVMELENLSFYDAVEKIADYYGIPIKQKIDLSKEKEYNRLHKESLLIAIDKVQQFFVEQLSLQNAEADIARRYAYNRWDENFCKEYGIGYAPTSWDALIEYANKNCIDLKLLKELDLIRFSEKSQKYYPLFRERVTIPIRNRFGKVIAFTCRYIGNDPDKPKYMNSSSSIIYKKNESVFGLDVASKQAARNGRFIIVEGAPDVLRLNTDDVGLTEAVASLGTAWSAEQFRQLKRSSHRIVFLPDADPPKEGELYGAGIKSVMKNGLLAVSMGFEVSVKEIPLADNRTKRDPDSYITDVEIFRDLDDVHFALWYGKKVLKQCDNETARTLAINDICRDVLHYVKDETLRSQLLASLSKIYGQLKLWKGALHRIEKEYEHKKFLKESGEDNLAAEREMLMGTDITIRNGTYCSPNSKGKLEPWSNFILIPMYHIIEGANAIRIFKIKNDRGVVRNIEFRQEELTNINRFQQRIESLGNFVFKGSAINFQDLKLYLYSVTQSAIQISKLGWNESERLYAFGDGIMKDGTFYPVDELGVAMVDEASYYLPAFSKMHTEDREAFQFERSFSCRRHGDIQLYDYLEKMIGVFGDNAKMGFSFLLATLFLDIVKQTSKRLALLNIFGRKGSGKTELGTALMSFFIRQNDPPSLATTSIASLNEMLSCAENNLVHIDEYKNAIHFQKIELLKQIWGGTGQTKKNMDGDKKVQRTFVHSGVILTGQDKPNRDDALFSRVIYLQYSKTVFSEAAKKRFDDFQQVTSKGVVHLTLQLLKLRPTFESDYAAHYASCKRDLINALADENIEDRVLNNWLAPLAAFRTAEYAIDAPFDYKELLDFCIKGIRTQNEELSKKSDVAEFWSILDANHMQGRIVDKAHFFIRYEDSFTPIGRDAQKLEFGETRAIIYMNFQSVVTTLMQRSASGGHTIGRLDPSSLESYLRTHEAFLGSKQMRFRVLLPNGQPDVVYETRDGKTTRRVREVRPVSLVFDYSLLRKKYDLSLETLERDENEIPQEEIESKFEAKPVERNLFDQGAKDEELPF